MIEVVSVIIESFTCMHCRILQEISVGMTSMIV